MTVRKSIFISAAQNHIGFILQFFVSVIVARLLSPGEIGLFSVAAVLVGFAHTLRDFGVASYIIQEKDLTKPKIQAAMALTFLSAWGLAAVIAISSGFAATFYREPGVRNVLLILSVNFLLIPFGSVPMAFMYRKMDFGHIAAIKLMSSLWGAVTTLWLAYHGWSYLSLAWGSLAGIMVTMVLTQVWRPAELPMLPSTLEIKRVFSFGSLASLIMILYDVAKSEADLIMGRISMSMVGYFSRGLGLLGIFESIVMRPLWDVAFPHFSSQSKNGACMKTAFLHAASMVTVVAWPFFLVMGLLARPVLLVLYGTQWESSVTPMRLLCVGALLTAPFLLSSSLMIAMGQMRQNLYQLLIRVPVLGVGVLLAAPHGLAAVGLAFVVTSFADMIFGLVQCKTVLNISPRELFQSVWKSAEVAFAAAAIPALIFFLDQNGLAGWSLLQLQLGIVGAATGWFLTLLLGSHPMKSELFSSVAFLRKLVSRS